MQLKPATSHDAAGFWFSGNKCFRQFRHFGRATGAKTSGVKVLAKPQGGAALSAAEVKDEVLAGLTTSFAMVPEVVAFAFVAGCNSRETRFSVWTPTSSYLQLCL